MAISLKRLNIQNFKAWEKTGDINFGNITMLYGTNSAGKSSLIQFLLLLKQTIDSSDNQRVLLSGSNSGLIDLGTISDFFTNHELDRNIKFSIDGENIGFDCEIFSQKIGKAGFSDLAIKSFLYRYGKNGITNSVGLDLKSENHYLLNGSQNYKRNIGKPHPIPSPLKFYRFPQEIFTYYKNTWELLPMTFELEKLFNKIIYIGPLRLSPSRTYEWSGERPSHVGNRGESVVSAILSAKNEGMRINRGKKKRYKEFMEYIAEWLRELGLVENFEIKKIGDSKVHKLQVQMGKNTPWVDIADVGFGVSQILPILVQAYYAEPGSVIIIEQPEIHLHPKVQSVLADVFINAAKERNIQFIIESHSEHLLRRMQLRIAQQEIDNNFVKTYFCKSISGRSVIESLDTDEYGNIKNWPENFFGDEAKEMEDFLLAQINAKKGKNKEK